MEDKQYDQNRLIDGPEKTVQSKTGAHAPFSGKPDPHVNFTKLLLISVSFLGMYIALYSA